LSPLIGWGLVTWAVLQVGDALLSDLDVARDDVGRRLDREDLVGEEGLAGVELGDELAGGGAETWKTDEADGA